MVSNSFNKIGIPIPKSSDEALDSVGKIIPYLDELVFKIEQELSSLDKNVVSVSNTVTNNIIGGNDDNISIMRRGIIPISSTGTSVRFRTPLQTNNYIVLKDCYDSSGSNTLGCSITNKSNLGFTATSTDEGILEWVIIER